MRLGSRFDGKVAVLVIAALAVAPLAFGGCGSSGGTTPTPQPLTASATPGGGNYTAAQMVDLAASGDGSGGASIYWTDDLSEPTDTSNLYVAGTPISVGTADTVLKFLAIPTSGTPTEVVLEGYTFATSPVGQEWAQSGHGQIANEAWRHWDDDVPAEVEVDCARCHSWDGFPDWALDNSVDSPGTLSYGLECDACHDGIPTTLYDEVATYTALDHVEFPSGDTATMAGDSNMCMGCHQGRSSMVQIDAAPINTVMQEPDYDSYSFINIHYYAAAASLMGNEVRGGYQYLDSKDYESRNTFPSHPDSLSTCVGCHMREGDGNHTWLPSLTRCQECHTAGSGFSTLGGSPGINYAAIQAALIQLYAEIQDYAATTLGYPIVYDSHAYPYFFNDNGAGINFGNKYDNFDKKLLQAAYNYQFGEKEPCGYLHNGTYMRQILHDSIKDLDPGATPDDIPPGRPGYTAPTLEPQAMYAAVTDVYHMTGHDNSGSDVFRHWDENAPPQTVLNESTGDIICSKCHTSPGFADLAEDGTLDEAYAPLSTVGCYACHKQADLYSSADTRWDDMANTGLRPAVDFPSGDTADLAGDSNVCMACHQGLYSTVQVDAATPNLIVQTPDYDSYDFINIHYYAAAATFFGTDVRGGYEWGANTYAGPVDWPGGHDAPGFTTCTGCHMIDGTHTFMPDLAQCGPCHGSPPTGWGSDFNGSGDPGANYDTIQTMLVDLEAEIERYGQDVLGSGLYYHDTAYPYFFEAGELPAYPFRYRDFNDHLLRAAYNFQVAKKEPAGYIHNATYIMQLLYDALDILDDELLNGSVGTRP